MGYIESNGIFRGQDHNIWRTEVTLPLETTDMDSNFSSFTDSTETAQSLCSLSSSSDKKSFKHHYDKRINQYMDNEISGCSSSISPMSHSMVMQSSIDNQKDNQSTSIKGNKSESNTMLSPQASSKIAARPEIKDEAYLEKRRRNNEAVKKSRLLKKDREIAALNRSIELQKENSLLYREIKQLRNQVVFLSSMMKVDYSNYVPNQTPDYQQNSSTSRYNYNNSTPTTDSTKIMHPNNIIDSVNQQGFLAINNSANSTYHQNMSSCGRSDGMTNKDINYAGASIERAGVNAVDIRGRFCAFPAADLYRNDIRPLKTFKQE